MKWYNICTMLACMNINNCSTILDNNIHCDLPTISPTPLPTLPPTFLPTYKPSMHPTYSPSMNPTTRPTTRPSSNPNKNTKVRDIIIISSASLAGCIGMCVSGIMILKKYYFAQYNKIIDCVKSKC